MQDILTAANLSKGGFYHHFASKEDVLKALCERRAERAAAYTEDALNGTSAPIARINAVLHGFIPLRQEETSFIAMLRTLIAKPEGRAIAMTYQDALEKTFLPMLQAEIASAMATEIVCPAVKDIGSVVLNIVNHCWMSAAAQPLDQLEMLNLLTKYRRTVEVLLDAPYGSIEIVRVEELDEVFRKIV